MIKNLKILFIVIITLLFITACAKKETLKVAEIKEPIKIAIITPLTGDAAVWGLEVKNGAEIAYVSFRSQKINGREVQLLFEDDKCDGKEGVTAIQKLINVNKVKITGGTVCSSVALAIAPIDEENKIIHLSAGASNPQITTAGDYMFRIWPSDDFEGNKIAEYASNILSIKSVAILYVNNEYGLGLKNAFTKKLTDYKGTILIEETFAPSSNDFRTQLLKIKEKSPEAVYVASNPQEMPQILKQIKEFGISSIILANGPAMEAVDTIKIAGNSSEGVYYAQPRQETSEDFKNKYSLKYGKNAGFASDLGYDVTMLLFNAVKDCNGDDTSCIKEKLYAIKDYKGASSIISFDNNGDVIVPFVIKKIEQGKNIVVQN